MRHLISSLQNHNLQLKGDVQRYKRKLRETQVEINKVNSLAEKVSLCGVLQALTHFAIVCTDGIQLIWLLFVEKKASSLDIIYSEDLASYMHKPLSQMQL